MNKQKLKDNGITLIALVITIIILLILAAVSVNLVLGENGMIARSKESRTQYDRADVIEKIQSDLMFEQLNHEEDVSDSALKTILEKYGTINYDTDGKTIKSITTTQGNYQILVSDIWSGNTNGKTEVDRSGLAVGDYINYEPDKNEDGTTKKYSADNLAVSITGSRENSSDISQNNLKWQILKIHDDGSIDVIGSASNQAIYFKLSRGYNNAVNVLNDVCKSLYSRGSIEARSVNIKDFENCLTADGRELVEHYKSGAELKVGETSGKYTSPYSNYPILYRHEIGSGINSDTIKTDGLDVSDNFDPNNIDVSSDFAKATNLKAKQTYWELDTEQANAQNLGAGADVLRPSRGESYWIASRSVECGKNYLYFYILKFDFFSGLGGANLYPSNGSVSMDIDDKFRPVITLGKDVKITPSDSASSASGTPHTITQY